MKYYKLSIGIQHATFGNNFSYEEITKERFNELKKRYENAANYRFANESVSKGYNITWDFQSNYNTGYITAIATDEDFEEIKQIIFEKVYNFLKDTIDWKNKTIQDLTNSANLLSEHPIYDAITKGNMRKEKINQILN
jgi:hypothetical protein